MHAFLNLNVEDYRQPPQVWAKPVMKAYQIENYVYFGGSFGGDPLGGKQWDVGHFSSCCCTETCLAAGLEIPALPTSTASAQRTLWRTCIPLRKLEEQILG